MFNLPADLSRAKILVTNDDGLYADGLGVLEKIARTLSDDVWVVAPETEQSCKSHSLTLDRPLNIKQISERKFHVNGTPSDTVLLAINHIFKDQKPDLVLSGINFGRNAGVDVTYSGTVAAAMEATMLGVPAIALSQKIVDGYASWNVAEKYAADVIRKLIAMKRWPKNTLMNVNFPHEKSGEVQGIKIVSHIGGKTRDDVLAREGLWGVPYYWVGHSVYEEYGDDTDVAALKAGYISVTPIKLDFTDYDFMAEMRKVIV